MEKVSKCAENIHCQKTIRCYTAVRFPATPALFVNIADFDLNHDCVQIMSKSEFSQLLFSNNKKNTDNDFILTPYCIDERTSTMIFIPINKKIILQNKSKMTFFYQTQIEYGKEYNTLYSINFDDLQTIIDSNDQFNQENILFIHNMARCGSNLLSSMISQVYKKIHQLNGNSNSNSTHDGNINGNNNNNNNSNSNDSDDSSMIVEINESHILYQLGLNYSSWANEDATKHELFKSLICLSIKSLILPIIASCNNGGKKKHNDFYSN